MNENVNKFIDSVQKQDYTAAKDEFQAAMAEKINSSFENKKIELASQMAGNSVVEEETTEHLDEKKTRQMMDPDKETMVVKDGKVEVIDKKDVKKYMKKGYELAEDTWVNESNKDYAMKKERGNKYSVWEVSPHTGDRQDMVDDELTKNQAQKLIDDLYDKDS